MQRRVVSDPGSCRDTGSGPQQNLDRIHAPLFGREVQSRHAVASGRIHIGTLFDKLPECHHVAASRSLDDFRGWRRARSYEERN